MRGSVLAILALSTLVSAQDSARDHYRELCKPPKDGKTYEDGYEVEYSCDSAGDSERLIDSVTKSTPDECAMLCKETAGCKGSDWFYGTDTCNIYSSDDVGDEVLGSVFIRRITPPEEEEEAGTTDEACEDEKKKCQKDLQTCTALKDDLQDELDECRRGRKEDKEACDKKIKELEAELSKCKDELTTCKKNECKVDPVWERRKEVSVVGASGKKRRRCRSVISTADTWSQVF
ncbi:hypothetical protein N7540_002154 [Penicillium herquei]|nr:hypothetical protein N7540_002154 [Penicillium herquei]